MAVSYMVQLALKAADKLAQDGIDIEVVDLRTIKPIDKQIIIKSVEKTGKLVIADVGWKTCGFSAEISAIVFEEAFEFMKAPVVRVALPDMPAPASASLEKIYYPTVDQLILAVRQCLSH